ncbi:hypothetical protein [Haloarchaeobius sp. HME9146]|uniref:hypothetical protein n=1 Tax=Haloarchaeobius sp. HME9146 TaxID=2978732 RepID=UPI0021C22072|nr:hypothetical protein [Haloarchaeobius sp. HME9146]MCT9095457.1 hypothetical protein [Haloarchaeobius sp. HME9146]
MVSGLPGVVLQSATDPIYNVEQIIEGFTAVAQNGDPLSFVLLAVGGLLTAAAAGGFGVLALGGLGSAIVQSFARSPPPEGGAQ